MATISLGTLPFSPVFRDESIIPGEKEVFVMDVAGSSTHINLILKAQGLGNSGNTRLSLFEDTNRNGVFDQTGISKDKEIGSIGGAGGDSAIHSRATGANRYFATVSNSANSSFLYQLRATDSKPSQIFQATPFSSNTLSGVVTKNRSLSDTKASEIYGFTLNSSTGVNTSLTGLTADADMRLIRDFDSDGVVDFGEEVARSTRGGINNDNINQITGAGKYILQVYQFSPGRIDYDLNFAAFSTNAAGPANSRATKEVQVGSIANDLSRKGVVNGRDPGDSFAFSLSEGQTLGLKLKELKGDSYLRVVQDRNSDGIIQKNEVLQTSIGVGNLEKISSLSGAGDYIAQVWQVGDGNARYNLTFDNAPSSTPVGLKI
jgi:hypothetical protein